ncbi:MAG: type III secretion system inner membrane ring lipoprotein SctJ [Granulosicoccus sp.]
MSMARHWKICRIGIVLCMIMVLTGCKEQELYSQLSEAEANDMVALLYGHGLPATKQRDENLFTVLTEPGSFSQAVNLLRANGLPRTQYETLGGMFEKKGFVSSPLEERARLNHAMSQELARTLTNIDGVVTAFVHLAVPEHDVLAEVQASASASVFIKHRSDVDLRGSVSQIKALVVNGIENLPYDNVTVALFETNVDRVLATSPQNDSVQTPPVLSLSAMPNVTVSFVAGSFGALIFAGGAFLLWRRSRFGSAVVSKNSPDQTSI